MNQPVARHDIGRNNGRAVDHHRSADGEGKRLSIGCVCRHAIGHIGSGNFCRNHVIEQDILECDLPFWSVKGCQIDAGISECLIGRGKEREWPGALEGDKQVSLDHSSHEFGVNASRLCCCRDVNWWRQHGVDDVDDPV